MNMENIDIQQLTERGNIWISSDFTHKAYFRLDGENQWLEVILIPENYPSWTINTVTISDRDLAKHIQENFYGYRIHKMSIEGVKTDESLGDPVVADIENEDD